MKKSVGTVSLTNDDYTLMMEEMTYVSNKILKKIDERKTDLTNSITNFLSRKAIK